MSIDTTSQFIHLGYWIHQYGIVAIFVLLALGIIALPIPEEPLLVLLGALIAQGTLTLIPAFCAAFLGACTGISVSYWLGLNVGTYLMQRFGKYVGITQGRIQIAHRWFERTGKWTLTIAYFVPGLRHLGGYIAGTVTLPYRVFAIFAYCGAFLWVCIFMSLGYFFNGQLNSILKTLYDYWLS